MITIVGLLETFEIILYTWSAFMEHALSACKEYAWLAFEHYTMVSITAVYFVVN